MEEQFVPYELALKLKELGFDEFCFGIYINNKFEPRYKSKNSKFKPNQKLDKNNLEYCTAPLWQQAFEWFRVNHLLIAEINVDRVPLVFRYRIFSVDNTWEGYQEVGDKGYKKARQACLEKLIEIVEKL